MLSPVKNIQFALKTGKCALAADKTMQNNILPSAQHYKKNIQKGQDISFTHYISVPQTSKLADDIEYNPYYYKLPEIPLEDGSVYQCMPDNSQVMCALEILDDKNVVYVAPTGTGKTAVAHFATQKNLEQGKKTIITVPLIALANDKYKEFSKIYGEQNVGILTGERKFNPNAPIIIETTEILYNQSSQFSRTAKNTGTIIFDEAHYIADDERGNVWENSIIEAVPNDIQILCLSATVGNADNLANWITSLNPHKEVSKIELQPDERHVPLIWRLFETDDEFSANFPIIKDCRVNIEEIDNISFSEKEKRALGVLYRAQNSIKNEYYQADDTELTDALFDLKQKANKCGFLGKFKNITEFETFLKNNYKNLEPTEIQEVSHLLSNTAFEQVKMKHTPHKPDNFPFLIDNLERENMLPALIFKLSKGACDDIVRDLKDYNYVLTTDEEKEQIQQIINEYKKEGRYLGTKFDEQMLLNGYASHHSGKMPAYKKLVEDLFSKKLLKVIAATSTLSAGINMPARTVVISDVNYKRFNPETQEIEYTPVTVNEFHQMAGRAGRRGIDRVGNVVLYNLHTPSKGFSKEGNSKDTKPDDLKLAYKLLSSKPDDLESQFRPDACLIAKYYDTHSTNKELYNTVSNSFKAYLSQDREKEVKNLVKKFENYSQILLKQGFLMKNNSKEFTLTPKGKLLLRAQGANPLMLSSLIYDEKLKDITLEQLAQIAGYTAGCDEQEENTEMQETIFNKFKNFLYDENDVESQMKQFAQARAIFENREQKILKSLNESKLPAKDILMSDNFSGFITYLWLHLNKQNCDSIQNFEKIINKALSSPSKDNVSRSAFNRKTSEGNVYKIIAQSTSVLKQIRRICEYALMHPEEYPNIEYYAKLKQQSIEALKLIKKEPIANEGIL